MHSITPPTHKNHLHSSLLFRCWPVIVFWCSDIQLLSDSKSISVLAAPLVQPSESNSPAPTNTVSAVNLVTDDVNHFYGKLLFYGNSIQIEYMQRFGYLEEGPPDVGALYSESAVSEAIKDVQRFGALPQTGILDEKTARLIVSPRCGVADILRRGAAGSDKDIYRSRKLRQRGRRHRRFVVGARPWLKRRITYFLANWSPQLGEREMAQDMRKAFEGWAKYGNLKFVQVFTPDADIIVGFGTRYHGDNYPFDGPGNILAHAYYPYEMGPFGGDIHFDNDERWTRNSSDAAGEINFLSVAFHELGHSLGLGHSPSPNSIMFPYYQSTSSSPDSDPHLGYDDVLAMYNLYIRANIASGDAEEETTSQASSTSRDGETNTERVWPAITTTTTTTIETTANEAPVNVTYHFHGDYETVDAHRRRFNYPETTPMPVTSSTTIFESLFPGGTLFPTRLNAAQSPRWKSTFSLPRWTTLDPIRTNWLEARSPASVEERNLVGAAHLLCQGHFDATFAINGHVFVFKNKFVWRMDANLFLVRGYPISHLFPGLPSSLGDNDGGSSDQRIVDAAYQRQTDGAVVLFSNHLCWTFTVTGFDFQLMDQEQRPQQTIWNLGLPANLSRIDAAFVWPKNGKTYFFSGESFWRYDEYRQSMDTGYPMSLTRRWHGIPSDINAVMTLPNVVTGVGKQTLFFKNNSYWLFDDHWVRPAIGYPRLISSLFSDC